MLRFGLIGLGHWGPNYARLLFGRVPGARLTACCDTRTERLDALAALYPGLRIYPDHRSMLEAGELDAVVISTPATTHRRLADDCLDAGLHILVEKPMAHTAADAEAMAAHAVAAGRTLMVAHTFLYNPVVHRVKNYVDSGAIGNLLYFYFHRTGLGPIRQDVNALWDLAPHDLSMARFWSGTDPDEVVARGESYLTEGVEDVVFVTMVYAGKLIASIHVSWLDPVKVRRATVVGDRQMVVFDDVELTEKLRVYDKGVSYATDESDFAQFQAAVRDGDIVLPRIDSREPLREQLLHFVDCVTNGREPRSGAEDGIAIVRTLERIQASLDEDRRRRSAPVASRLVSP